jgi:hypothetical protein
VARVRTDGGPESRAGTEEMREAMVEARALFEDLVTPTRQDTRRHRADNDAKPSTVPPTPTRPEGFAPDGRSHLPWSFTRRQAKGS